VVIIIIIIIIIVSFTENAFCMDTVSKLLQVCEPVSVWSYGRVCLPPPNLRRCSKTAMTRRFHESDDTNSSQAMDVCKMFDIVFASRSRLHEQTVTITVSMDVWFVDGSVIRNI
jgi:hypothetical protein